MTREFILQSPDLDVLAHNDAVQLVDLQLQSIQCVIKLIELDLICRLEGLQLELVFDIGVVGVVDQLTGVAILTPRIHAEGRLINLRVFEFFLQSHQKRLNGKVLTLDDLIDQVVGRREAGLSKSLLLEQLPVRLLDLGARTVDIIMQVDEVGVVCPDYFGHQNSVGEIAVDVLFRF